MTKFLVDNCCFCVNLRVASFIIGYLNLILNIIVIIGGSIILSTVAGSTVSSDETEKHAAFVICIVVIVTLLYTVPYFIYTLILLVGLNQKDPQKVKTFLVCYYIYLLISLIMIVQNVITNPYDGTVITSRALGFSFSVYCAIVVRSYYHKMLEESNNAPADKP